MVGAGGIAAGAVGEEAFGAWVGAAVDSDGATVGEKVSAGSFVGLLLLGDALGALVGIAVGAADGDAVGSLLVGTAVGTPVGPGCVGPATGPAVGSLVVGTAVGSHVGDDVGSLVVGAEVGLEDGNCVGLTVVDAVGTTAAHGSHGERACVQGDFGVSAPWPLAWSGGSKYVRSSNTVGMATYREQQRRSSIR